MGMSHTTSSWCVVTHTVTSLGEVWIFAWRHLASHEAENFAFFSLMYWPRLGGKS